MQPLTAEVGMKFFSISLPSIYLITQGKAASDQKLVGTLINTILNFINFYISLYTVAITAYLYIYYIKIKIHAIRFDMLHATYNSNFIDK